MDLNTKIKQRALSKILADKINKAPELKEELNDYLVKKYLTNTEFNYCINRIDSFIINRFFNKTRNHKSN